MSITIPLHAQITITVPENIVTKTASVDIQQNGEVTVAASVDIS